MELLNISRGKIEVLLDNNKSVIVQGEAMIIRPMPELSEYVVYKNSIKWKNLEEGDCIDDGLANDILSFIEKEFENKNLKLIIE